jgi:hypothetical protein
VGSVCEKDIPKEDAKQKAIPLAGSVDLFSVKGDLWELQIIELECRGVWGD